MSKLAAEAFAKVTGAGTEMIEPPSGFLFRYLDFADPLTEAPRHYHLFCALSVLSVVVGRNVYLERGSRGLYPNSWILLVGESSRLKKSTALGIADDLLYRHNPALVFPHEFSREAMLTCLKEQPSGVFIWSELGSALQNFNASYMDGSREMFTNLFDNPPSYRRKLKTEDIVIEKPCISILSASTIDWVNESVRASDVCSGFLARFVYVPATERSKILPFPPPKDIEIESELLDDLERIAGLRGAIGICPDALKYYKDWYRKSMHRMDELSGSPVLSFASRLNDYALKFAMLYQVSQNSDMVISEENMYLGCACADWCLKSATWLIEDELVFTERERNTKKVERLLERKGAVDHSSLLKSSKLDADTFERVMRTLTEMGRAHTDYCDGESGRSGRKTYRWIGDSE